MQNYKIEGTIKLPDSEDIKELFGKIISIIKEYDDISCEIHFTLTSKNEPETII